MDMKRIAVQTLVLAAAVAAVLPATAAHATGDRSGNFGAGGVAKGDISQEAAETDRITIDLGVGARLSVSFSAEFAADFVLTDPDGLPVDLGFRPGRSKLKRKVLPVTRAGTYEFTVSSANGTQGRYTLVAQQAWAKSFKVQGSGQQVIDFGMPTVGKVSAVISRRRGAPGRPRILSLVDPGDNNLMQNVAEPAKDTARITRVPTNLAGTYHLTVTSTDASSAWVGEVSRIVARTRRASLRLANGLTKVGFSKAGVDDVFRRQCAGCHGWAADYFGARGYAQIAVAKMISGSMPPKTRVPASQIALVQSWIATGFGR